MSTYTARKKEAPRRGISSAKLLSTSALTAASILALAGPALADNAWVLNQVGGSFDTDTSIDATTTITQNSSQAIGEGNLDIESYQTVNIIQGSNSDLFVARDNRGDPTRILGSLNANGRVMVIDTNGVFFGAGSTVNVGSIIASTADVSNSSIMSGDDHFEFSNFGDGGIEMNGTINVADAGLAAFVSPHVTNNGIINARMGTVAFAAGETVTLDLYGDGLVEIAVEGELADALLETTGEIHAEGGVVQMTAVAAKDAVDNIINVEGLITVASVTQEGGKIILSGGSKGNVNVGGSLDASGTDGGSINVAGENITVSDTAELYADGGKGVDQNGNGGSIDVIANTHLDYRGSLFARGGALGGNGGNAETSGYEFLGYSGYADLSAANGDMGFLLLDPEFAVIHSGLLHNPLGQGYVLAASALANAMANANVTVQAVQFIDVGTRDDNYNTGNAAVDAVLNGLVGTSDIDFSSYEYSTLNTPPPGCGAFCQFFWALNPSNYTNYTGTTSGNITFQSDVVNFNKDITMGNGDLGVDAMTVNLDSRIYGADGTTLLGDSRLFSNAGTVNVLSNAAKIQQGVWFTRNNSILNVGSGEYNESVILNRRGLTVNGANAGTAGYDARLNDETVVTGNSPAFTVRADGVTIDGFTMNGPGLTYGVFLRDVKGTTIQNNIISNSSIAAIGGVVDHHPAPGTLVIDSNFIDGSNTGDGIALAGDSAGRDGTQSLVGVDIDITNNQIGEDGNAIGGKGITFTKIGDLGDLIETAGATNVTADILIDNNDVYSTENAIEFGGSVADATINITNNDLNSAADGIQFAGNVDGSDVDVTRNSIKGGQSGVNMSGFDLTNGATVNIDNNVKIAGVAGDAVVINDTVLGGAIVSVSGNRDVTAGDDGVDLNNVSGATIARNHISGAGDNGIEVSSSTGAEIFDNEITDVSNDGINVEYSSYANIYGNLIYGQATALISNPLATSLQGAGRDGIHVEHSHSVIIDDNTIQGDSGLSLKSGRGAGRHGIYVSDGRTYYGRSNGVQVTNNNILGHIGLFSLSGSVGGDGIHVVNDGAGYSGSHPTISGNTVQLTGENGIFVGNTYGISIDDNDIDGAGANGIYLSNSEVSDITNNEINDTDNHGIKVYRSGFVDIVGNSIHDAGDDGIHVRGSRYADILGNDVYRSGDDGIDADGPYRVVINNNNVHGARDNGIEMRNHRNADILGNDIRDAGNNGIEVSNADAANISGNTITRSGWDGVNVYYSNGVQVIGNTITDTVGASGVAILHSADANVDDNDIDNSGRLGVYVGNGDNVTINNNRITNSGIAAGNWSGIHIENTDGATVTLNTVDGTTLDGINIGEPINLGVRGNSGTFLVSGNMIDNTGRHGIHVIKTANIDVLGNQIGTTGGAGNINGDGIRLWTSHGANIKSNVITQTDDVLGKTHGNGIHVGYSNNVTVGGDGADKNIITDVDWDGIRVQNADNINILYNEITDAERAGIYGLYLSNSKIRRNKINGTNSHSGIHIQGGDDVRIITNFVDNVNEFGILAEFTSNLRVRNNNVDETGQDGIYINSSHDAKVFNNRVGTDGGSNTIGNHGIRIDSSNNVLVQANTVKDTRAHGILVNASNFADVYGNMVTNAGYDGINIAGGNGADIWDNTITNSDHDAIDVSDNREVNVRYNHISGAGDNGIEVSSSTGAEIFDNEITDVSNDGINVEYSSYANIYGNDIRDARGDGIDVEGSNYVNVNRNIIFDVLGSGIEISDGYQADIRNNLIRRAGEDGINLRDVESSNITGNRIRRSADDGIDVRDGRDTRIVNNNIRGSGDDGIRVSNIHSYGPSDWNVTIRNNTVDRSRDDGIEVTNSGDTRIVNNDVTRSRDDGIRVADPRGYEYAFNSVLGGQGPYGYMVEPARVRIVDNTVSGAGADGIEVAAHSVDLRIGRNEITDSGENGILLYAKSGFDPGNFQPQGPVTFGIPRPIPFGSGEFNSNIFDNNVTNSGTNGLHVMGAGHDDVILEGNTFTNNPVGARFESGAIDLTGRTNSFIVESEYVLPAGYEFVTGLQFDPALTYPLALQPGVRPVSPPASLTIVGENLGTTEFTGFLERPVGKAYFVRFEDGAILDSQGGVITIDGTFANFDGIVPNAFGNLLPPTILASLEDRIFDADDLALNGRGQLFVGNPILGLENIEDFFNKFDQFSTGPNGLRVTLAGLPSTGFGNNFANIEPAAGEGSEEDFANIEPAAGGDEVACWGDAVSSAANGAPVSYDFGGSFEESLIDASACQSF